MDEDVYRGMMSAQVPPDADQVWQGVRTVGSNVVHYLEPDDRSRDNFSALAQPIASVQYYCKPHRPEIVLLVQGWTCYKAVVYRDEDTGQFRVGILQLRVPSGMLVVVSRAPGSKSVRGLNYRVRVQTAVVEKCFRLEEAKATPGASELFELTRFPLMLANDVQLHKCDVCPGMVLHVTDGQLHTNPQVFDGAGISIEPLLPESLRVASYYEGQLAAIAATPAVPSEHPPVGSFLAAVLQNSGEDHSNSDE